MPHRVEMSLPALTRAWRQCGQDSVWVRLRTGSPFDTTTAALTEAVRTANRAECDATGDAPRVVGSSVSVSPTGPVIFGFCDSPEALRSWLDQVCAGLGARGVSRKLISVRYEQTVIDNSPAPALTAALTVPIY